MSCSQTHAKNKYSVKAGYELTSHDLHSKLLAFVKTAGLAGS